MSGHGSGGRSESRWGKCDPNKIMTFSMNTLKKIKRILSEELAFFQSVGPLEPTSPELSSGLLTKLSYSMGTCM